MNASERRQIGQDAEVWEQAHRDAKFLVPAKKAPWTQRIFCAVVLLVCSIAILYLPIAVIGICYYVSKLIRP